MCTEVTFYFFFFLFFLTFFPVSRATAYPAVWGMRSSVPGSACHLSLTYPSQSFSVPYLIVIFFHLFHMLFSHLIWCQSVLFLSKTSVSFPLDSNLQMNEPPESASVLYSLPSLPSLSSLPLSLSILYLFSNW